MEILPMREGFHGGDFGETLEDPRKNLWRITAKSLEKLKPR
jgi:hypothetical protein